MRFLSDCEFLLIPKRSLSLKVEMLRNWLSLSVLLCIRCENLHYLEMLKAHGIVSREWLQTTTFLDVDQHTSHATSTALV